MGQCRTLDADVTIRCYYGDYSSWITPILRPFNILLERKRGGI